MRTVTYGAADAMPWRKDFVLFTDFNSGLWAAKLQPKNGVS